MKIRLALPVVVAQVAVVAFMAAQREWITRTGTPITLRTAPIDPNDPMRGEFVRFRYEINTVPAEYFRGGLAQWPKLTDYHALRRLRDTVVYATLRVDEFGFARLVALSDAEPASGLFLRGRVGYVSDSGGIQTVQVRYGVESLYLPQGAGKRLETLSWGERRGVPIDTAVSVGRSGIGVLKTFTWEPLGIIVTPDRPARDQIEGDRSQRAPLPQTQRAGLTGVTIELKNFGERDLAIVDQADGQSFRLRADVTGTANRYRWANEDRTVPVDPATTRIVVLHPGEKHTMHLDLTAPRWWVKSGAGDQSAMPLRDVRDPWQARFRLEYVPPSPAQVRGLPHAELVRHVPLLSRLITGGAD